MIKLLKKWHWLHSWSQWKVGPKYGVRYPWTKGSYAYIEQRLERTCEVCKLIQTTTVQTS